MEFFHLRHPSRVSVPLRKGIFVAQLVIVQPGSPELQAKKTKNTSSVQKKAKHIVDAVAIQKKRPVLKKAVSAPLTKQKQLPKAASPPVKKKTASPPVRKKAESLKVLKGATPSKPSSPSSKKPPGVGPPTLTKQDKRNADCSPRQKPDPVRADSPPVLKKVKKTKSTAEALKQSVLCKTSVTTLKKPSNRDQDVTKPAQKNQSHKRANGTKALGRAENASPSLQKEKDEEDMKCSPPGKLSAKSKLPSTPIQNRGRRPKPAASILKKSSLARDSSPSFQKPLGKEKPSPVPPVKPVDTDNVGMAKTVAAPAQKPPNVATHATGPLKRHADFDEAACSLFQRQLDEAKFVSPPVRKKARLAVSDLKKQSDFNKELESSQDKATGAPAKGQQAKETSPPLKGQSSPFQKLPNKTKTKAATLNLEKKTDWDKVESLPFKKLPGSTVSSPPGRRLGAEAKQAIWQGIADRINALGLLPKTGAPLKEVKRRKEKAAANLKSSKATRTCSKRRRRAAADHRAEIAPNDARSTDGFRNVT